MTSAKYNQVLESGGTLKEPFNIPVESANSIRDYMLSFPYHIVVNLGKVYTSEFKEFNRWCEANLGKKYKDWFLIGRPGEYTLYLKDNKRSMFLALKYSESIDNTNI